MTNPRDERDLLLRLVEEAYDRPTWNGTNLRATIRRVKAGEAAWRPRGARRSIAEIVVHCAYWKYAIRRNLLQDPRGSFALPGSNWFPVERSLSAARWKEYVALLEAEHRKLCQAIRSTRQTLRAGPGPGGAMTRKVYGVAMHDAYHTGGIRQLRAMYRRTQGPGRVSIKRN